MGELLANRRKETESRLKDLVNRLDDLGTSKLASGKACVYLTGSFARGEATRFSDLDLFIAGDIESERAPKLRRLDEICIKADLIQATRDLGIPEFSGDGEYLRHHLIRDLVKNLGDQKDDAENTFTARLLLLLESECLLERGIYQKSIEDVIATYWRDYKDHKNDFIPAFLTNDILRLWRTFCVNYEARTTNVPAEKKAKRKLKNYKLKHSRLLTCYSALVFLLFVYGKKQTVSPDDAKEMASKSPTERLELILNNQALKSVHSAISHLLERYEQFLAVTERSEAELVKQFLDPNASKELMQGAYAFGDTMMEVVEFFGKTSNKLYRLLVV